MLEDEARVDEVDRVRANLREKRVTLVLEDAVLEVAVEFSRQPDHLGRAVDPVTELEPGRKRPNDPADPAAEIKRGFEAIRLGLRARQGGSKLVDAGREERVEIPSLVPGCVATADRPQGIEPRQRVPPTIRQAKTMVWRLCPAGTVPRAVDRTVSVRGQSLHVRGL